MKCLILLFVFSCAISSIPLCASKKTGTKDKKSWKHHKILKQHNNKSSLKECAGFTVTAIVVLGVQSSLLYLTL